MSDIWPVTIIRTRYGGTYEGGAWAAFNLDAESIPEDVMGSDIICASWWSHFGGGVGVGGTPEAALADLESLEKRLTLADIERFMPEWAKQWEEDDDDD